MSAPNADLRAKVAMHERKITQILTGAAFGSGTPGAPATVFTFTQSTPSVLWVIDHDLGVFPTVTVIVGGDQVDADVIYVDANTIHIGFTVAVSGTALLN